MGMALWTSTMTAKFMLALLATKQANAFGSASDEESQQHKRLRSHSWSWSWPWNDNPTTSHSTTLDHRDQHEYLFYEWPESFHTTYSPTASPTIDSTSYVPTREHSDEDLPFHYSNYRNSHSNEHDYFFYEWPDRQHSTYSPTSTPPSEDVPKEAQATTLSQPPTRPLAPPIPTQNPTYYDQDLLFREHFLDGFGVFQDHDSPNTNHYPSYLGRQGVVELKSSSTLSSYGIAVNEGSPQFNITFAFHAESVDASEGFCLEYSVNDDVEWNPVRCWQTSVDFENNLWNDEFSAILNLDDSRIQVDSIRIRFQTIARGDDASIKFDRIYLLQK